MNIWALVNKKAAVDIGIQIAVWVSASNSLGIYPEVELLDHMTNLYLTFMKKKLMLSLPWLHHFTLP